MRYYLGLLVLFAGLAAILSHSNDAIQTKLGLTPFSHRIDTVLAETLSGSHISTTVTTQEYLIYKRHLIPASCKKAYAFASNMLKAVDANQVASADIRNRIDVGIENRCFEVK
jgi:hypothetical protein